MRRASEKKMLALRENEEKPDEEKMNMRPLTALDEIVLDIMGKGKGTTQKNEIEIPENSSFLDPAFMAKIKYEDDDEDNLGEDNDDSVGGQVLVYSALLMWLNDYWTNSQQRRQRSDFQKFPLWPLHINSLIFCF